MNPELWRWIGNEEALSDLVAGLSSWGLLLLIVVCIAVLSKSADWMIDGVVHHAARAFPESSSERRSSLSEQRLRKRSYR